MFYIKGALLMISSTSSNTVCIFSKGLLKIERVRASRPPPLSLNSPLISYICCGCFKVYFVSLYFGALYKAVFIKLFSFIRTNVF